MEKHLLFENLAKATEQLPENKILNAKIDGKTICMARSKGQIFAFEAKCPHLKVPLAQSGVINPFGQVVCKEHAHAFSLQNGECQTHPHERLITYKVTTEEDGKIYLLL